MVLFVGNSGGVDLGILDRRVTNTIAKPLVFAKSSEDFIAEAHDSGLGVVLPGEAWRNQLPIGHPKRAGAFKDMQYALKDQLDISAAPLSPDFVAEFSGHYLEEQLTARATLTTTPGHVHDIEGGVGRENDLALAEAMSKDFLSRRAHHPVGEGGLSRTLFASIFVHGRLLIDAVPSLIDAYASIRVGGYWVVVVNCSGTRQELAAVSDLVVGLEARTGRPSVVSGAGPAQLTLPPYGAAATCTGVNGVGFSYPPPDWAEVKRKRAQTKGNKKDPGIAVPQWHREALANLPLGPKWAERRAELFRRWPCDCGAHERDQPPAPSEVRTHNLICGQRDAAGIFLPAADAGRAELARRINEASAVRAAAGMTRLGASWRGAAFAHRRRVDNERIDQPGS
jgi:hypothetical protein